MNARELSLEVDSVSELHWVARSLALNICSSCMIGLVGPLGAGKTEFVRGVLGAFNKEELVSSPSYVLENIYCLNDASDCPGGEAKRPVTAVRHLDLYRLSAGAQISDLLDLNTFEYAKGDVFLALIEWFDKVIDWASYADMVISIDFCDIGSLGQLSCPSQSFSPLSYSTLGCEEVSCESKRIIKCSALSNTGEKLLCRMQKDFINS